MNAEIYLKTGHIIKVYISSTDFILLGMKIRGLINNNGLDNTIFDSTPDGPYIKDIYDHICLDVREVICIHSTGSNRGD